MWWTNIILKEIVFIIYHVQLVKVFICRPFVSYYHSIPIAIYNRLFIFLIHFIYLFHFIFKFLSKYSDFFYNWLKKYICQQWSSFKIKSRKCTWPDNKTSTNWGLSRYIYTLKQHVRQWTKYHFRNSKHCFKWWQRTF